MSRYSSPSSASFASTCDSLKLISRCSSSSVSGISSLPPGVRGGPTYREMQLCMEMIADTGLMASLDVMELNPALDVRNGTAEVALELIESLFGKSTLMRR